jgi:CDP-glycerol glycerophosphotransferase (TagB/SpsB family)
MNLYLLYIDPGTGSAFFSIIISIATAAFFLFQAVFIKAKAFFIGGKAKTGIKNKYVIYAEDKRYYTLFKPIIEEFEKRGIELLYLTSSQDDPVFAAGFQYIKTELLGKGNKAFAMLNFLSADFVLATTPGLDVYQWKRSKMVKHYSHIFHAPTENALYELYAMDYFDSVLITGDDFQESVIRKLEKVRKLPEKKIVTVGCPYLDEYAKKIEQIPNQEKISFTVLVSLTWGKLSLLSSFGEKLLDSLVKTEWQIIVRPHPQSFIVEKDIVDRLTTKYANNSNLKWDLERDNIYSLKKADIMISDYSGIIFDYMFLLNKPVFYFSKSMDLRTFDAFEIYEKQEDIWTFRTLKKTGVALTPDLFDKLPEMITKASSNAAFKSAIAEAKSEAWHYQGEAGKRVADFMIETAGK